MKAAIPKGIKDLLHDNFLCSPGWQGRAPRLW